jgi:CheY-like chemotaxis protein
MDLSNPSNVPTEVLVAEDNKINQRIIKELLRKEGFHATIVANGKEVLTLLNQQHFDLLILDFHMPELNGLDTIKAIRAHTDKKINSLTVILFTAEQDKQHLNDIQAYGIEYTLQKPINQAEFSRVLTQAGNFSKEASTPNAASNMDYLMEITSGNTNFMIELIDIFIEEVPQAIEKIKAYYEQGDWEAVQTAAHKLRSNYKYVGAGEAEELLHYLDTDFGHEQNKQTYGPYIEALEKMTLQLLQTLLADKQKLRQQ